MAERAINILSKCEAREGAVLRSRVLHFGLLQATGQNDDAQKLIKGVAQTLKTYDMKECRGWDGQEASLTEDFMARFVLPMHR